MDIFDENVHKPVGIMRLYAFLPNPTRVVENVCPCHSCSLSASALRQGLSLARSTIYGSERSAPSESDKAIRSR